MAREDVAVFEFDDLVAETVPYIDVTAAEMLAAVTEALAHAGVRLVIAGDVGPCATCSAAQAKKTPRDGCTRRSTAAIADLKDA